MFEQVEGDIEIDMKREVLEALPRTTRIDGLEIIKRVKISMLLKIAEKMREVVEKETAKRPGSVSVGYSINADKPINLSYDEILNILEILVAEKKAARTRADLPTFQRID